MARRIYEPLFFVTPCSAEGAAGAIVADCARSPALACATGDRGFRHEKTKAKRSTYRGGLIDTNAVNSIKFENDDDE